MADAYQHLRSLPFRTVAESLGVDLSTFKARKNGELYGKCPIHDAKSNKTSFNYSPDGRFHCFSCNAKGRGALDFTMQLLKIGFQAACERLSGVTIPKAESPVVEAPNASNEPLQPLLKDTWKNYQVPCEWLEKRIPDAAIRERYGVFCYNNPARRSAYSGRVMLPVKSSEGILYGYMGRRIDNPIDHTHDKDGPKYLFPKNLPKHLFLFGAYELWEGRPHRIVYLVESPFCVMKFASLGFPAVSPFGWSVSEDQIAVLKSLAKGVVYLPDRNKQKECQTVLGLLAAACWLRFPPLPPGCEDPESLSRDQVLALTQNGH